MTKIQQLRERRAAKAKEARNMLDQNPGKWTPELQTQYDALITDIGEVDAQVANEQRMLDIEAENATGQLPVREREGRGVDPMRDMRDRWFRGGDGALSAQDWQTYRNTMSTTTPSEGGYTIQSTVAAEVLDKLKAFGGVREAGATIMRTANGSPFSWPTSDGTSEVGEILAENAAATDLDISFGTTALNAFKYSSKVVTVPIELLQDSVIDIEAFVNTRITTRIARITNKHFTVGVGTTEPMGVATGAVDSGIVGAAATTVTYDELLGIIHSVDPAYRRGTARWMWHDSTTLALRKLKDQDNRPLWIPSYDAGAGGVNAEPDRFAGYGIIVNQDMPAMADDAKSILFGDFSYYIIREVMAVTYYRFTDSAYAKKGQVGFLAMARFGGANTDVGGAIRYFKNANV